jgi:hypothetical protein
VPAFQPVPVLNAGVAVEVLPIFALTKTRIFPGKFGLPAVVYKSTSLVALEMVTILVGLVIGNKNIYILLHFHLFI